MSTLEQLKYEPQPIPAKPKVAAKPSPLTDRGTLLAAQTFERQTFQPLRPMIFAEQKNATPLFGEMEPLERAPYIPYDMRRDIYPGTSNLPLYLRK